mgnify:CR=1 FL=1
MLERGPRLRKHGTEPAAPHPTRPSAGPPTCIPALPTGPHLKALLRNSAVMRPRQAWSSAEMARSRPIHLNDSGAVAD